MEEIIADTKLEKGSSQRKNENLQGENHAGEIPYLMNGKMNHSLVYSKKEQTVVIKLLHTRNYKMLPGFRDSKMWSKGTS